MTDEGEDVESAGEGDSGEDTGSGEEPGSEETGSEDPGEEPGGEEPGEEPGQETDSQSETDSEHDTEWTDSEPSADSSTAEPSESSDTSFSDVTSLIDGTESIGTTSSTTSSADTASVPALISTATAAEIPALAISATKNLSIKMQFVNSEGEEPICVVAAPYIYVYLREKTAAASTTAPTRYLVKLRGLTEDSEDYWYVSGEVVKPVVGNYDVEYYTARQGKEDECDAAASTGIATAEPDTSIFEKVVPGTNYAGSILKLDEDAKTTLEVKDAGASLAFTSSANHSSVTLGAYKMITGVSDTTASFGFNLYRSDASGSEFGNPISYTESDSKIEEGTGVFVPFEGIIIPAEGDYYFKIEEDDTAAPTYFTLDSKSVNVHVRIEYNEHGKLSPKEITTTKSGETSSARSLTVGDLGETINIEMENKDIAEQYRNITYELYGPIPGMSVRDEDIIEANLYKTSSTQAGGKSAFSAVPVPTGSWWSYAVVEKLNGVENRNHRVVIPARRLENESPKWYVKDYGTFTNTYKSGEKGTGVVTIKKVVEGKPSTDQKFNFQMVASGATKAMWSGSLPGDDGKYEKTIKVGFPKAGTYTATLSEVAGSAKGYTYDKTEHELKFVVTDDKQGSYDVKITVDGKETKSAEVTFTNTYAVDVPIRIVTNTEPMRAIASGEFRVRNSKGSKVGKMWTSDGNAHVVTVPGDGTYTIEEITPPTDYRKQTDKQYLQFTVKDGVITYNDATVTTVYVPHTALSGEFEFTNVAESDTSKPVSASDFYLYRITASKGTSAYESAAESLAKGTIRWDELTATAKQTTGSDGKATFTVGPNTYYVIRQTAVSGPYQRTPDSKAAIIRTSYSAKSDTFNTSVISGNNILVKKNAEWIWKQAPTKVTIYMKSSSGAYLSGAKLSLASTTGTVATWETDGKGKTFTGQLNLGSQYRVSQTNQLQGYKTADPVTFTVASSSDGTAQTVTITAQKEATSSSSSGGGGGGGTTSSSATSSRTAVQYVNVRARQVWTNADGTVATWPEGVTVRVQLYANNQEVQGRVLSLNAQNPSGTFENLPKNDSQGRAITYAARVTSVTGYTGEGEMPKGTLQVEVADLSTNSGTTASGTTASGSTTGNTTQTNSASTGDMSPIVPLVALMTLALAVIAIVVLGRKKNRK
ncbi:MAG: FctA domain-containing protein [Lachnospiraceae bacterium]|nr:FctA domain-containing protein [Lachnospiraceae bacterium]